MDSSNTFTHYLQQTQSGISVSHVSGSFVNDCDTNLFLATEAPFTTIHTFCTSSKCCSKCSRASSSAEGEQDKIFRRWPPFLAWCHGNSQDLESTLTISQLLPPTCTPPCSHLVSLSCWWIRCRTGLEWSHQAHQVQLCLTNLWACSPTKFHSSDILGGKLLQG